MSAPDSLKVCETSRNPKELAENLNDIAISMESFVALSNLFGYKLVDRSAIRKGQNPELAETLSRFVPGKELPVKLSNQYFYGCVDWMMQRDADGNPHFYVVEVNGSNAAGLTDVPLNSFWSIAESVAMSLDAIDLPRPCIILNSYTGEKNINVHERTALAEGIRKKHPDKTFDFISTRDLSLTNVVFNPDAVTFVIGPITEALRFMDIKGNQLCLKDVPVKIIINDLTIDRICKKFPEMENCMDNTLVLNKIHPIVNYKFHTYDVMSKKIIPALKAENYAITPFEYYEAKDPETLVSLCKRLVLEEKKSMVIKPYSSSVGVGIQFLNAGISEKELEEAVGLSMEESESRYQETSNIFPYTICEFVETALCHFPQHNLMNRKFDLRFFVVRKDDGLYGIPGVIKLASQEYDTASFHREGLQTNTMRVTQQSEMPMEKIFELLIRPLNSHESLDALGLSIQDVQKISEMSAKIIGHLAAEVS